MAGGGEEHATWSQAAEAQVPAPPLPDLLTTAAGTLLMTVGLICKIGMVIVPSSEDYWETNLKVCRVPRMIPAT